MRAYSHLPHLVAIGVIAALLILPASARAAEPEFPDLTGRVVEQAGILSQSTIDDLTQMLASHERVTGQQLVVVTLSSLQGYSIEQFGYQLGRHWGIGQKGVNNGVLLIVAPNEHKVRIEVGYGMEGVLTDAQCSVIIQQIILPEFRRGDFDSGVMKGTSATLQVMSGGQLQAAPEPRAGLAALFPFFFLLLIFAIVFIAMISARRHAHDPAYQRMMRRRRRHGYSPFFAFPGGFGGHSGSGSSGGGFSGGGGSFGGGGASGSW